MKEIAIAYLASGWSIIPLRADKRPLLASWAEYMTRRASREEIDAWWSKWPEANIGGVTGKISNVTLIDCDVFDRFAETKTVVPWDVYPETETARTGSGGIHLLYNYCPEADGRKELGYKVDLKSQGGYMVLPPSKTWYEEENKATGEKKWIGGTYEWVKKIPKADFPRGLLPERKGIKFTDIIFGVKEGSRDNTAASIAGLCIQKGLTYDEAFEFMMTWDAKNQPMMGERLIREKLKSIVKTHQRNHPPEAEKEKPYRLVSFTKLVEESMTELDSLKPGDCISTGYPWLDEKITGLFPGELVVLGGVTGTGKTTFATRLMYTAAAKQGVKCCIMALEDRLVDYGIKAVYFEIGRILAEKQEYNFSWNEYRRNEIIDPRYPELRVKAIERLKTDNVTFFEAKKMMSIDLLEKVLDDMTAQGYKLFLVDHLHYFDLLKEDKSKADYIEQVMVRLKTCQNKNGARVILVVHYKKLDGKKPGDDSYKDSMAIAQNANYAIHLSRAKGEENRLETTMFISKSRNPNGECHIELTYEPAINDYAVKKGETWKLDKPTSKKLDDDFKSFGDS